MCIIYNNIYICVCALICVCVRLFIYYPILGAIRYLANIYKGASGARFRPNESGQTSVGRE